MGTSHSSLSALDSRRSLQIVMTIAVMSLLLFVVVAGKDAFAAGAASRAKGHTKVTTPPPRTDAAGTVWLCRPGLVQDPCDSNMRTTVVRANGSRTIVSDTVPRTHRFDCFYLYPTASIESSVNSDLTVQPNETVDATDQASRFSKVCNVWAPMYNQVTVSGLSVANTTDPGAYTIAYNSVLSAWNDFLANYDDGTPIIFIGHSQGSVMLIKLLESQVDPNPSLRHLLVAAIIAGGNVTVPTGKTVGGTFQNLPLCTSASESGCVIAYSSFPSEPPANANFGIPGQGISLNTGQTATSGVQVACVNPADIAGGTADLETYWPQVPPPPMPSMEPSGAAVTTPWIYYPSQYTATCESEGQASWLQVTAIPSKKVTRAVVGEIAGPTWGYHFQDINLALGNLVNDAHNAEVAYASQP